MNIQPPSGLLQYDRDRDREIDSHRLQHMEEAARAERDRDPDRHRDMEREYSQGPPHHSTAGSLPIHQPVASRISGTISSAEALLGGHAHAPPPGPPQPALGGPRAGAPGWPDAAPRAAGPQQMFAASPHAGASGPVPPHGPSGPPAPGQVLIVAGPPQGNRGRATQGGQPPQPPGQQPVQQGQGTVAPILNDALCYLDQVKFQFQDNSNVYNRFLDIMKDFKSQAIDTPGVITRVSELFSGHPILIEGFNTFLPPGYKIECSPGNDPTTIRVTTPMGTTVQSITTSAFPVAGRQPPGEGVPPPPTGLQLLPLPRNNPWTHVYEGPDAAVFGSNGTQISDVIPYDRPHAQQAVLDSQRGINAAHALGLHHARTPTPGAPHANGGTLGEPRRGPVEFNHAISYVNKIKNRFHDKPEIYKTFLEILQTYQREQKPIQEVYTQVTSLFHGAPDLLDDFKQFLPETTSKNAKPLNVQFIYPDEGQFTPHESHVPQILRDAQKMPALGSFAPPPSASKENKKRARTEKQIHANPPGEPTAAGSRQGPPVGNLAKKAKLNHKQDASPVEATLTPVLPEPHGPSAASNRDDLAFFDRIKKSVGNKAQMNEFLKICNLFSTGVIDRATLYKEGHSFFGNHPDLMLSWAALLGLEGQDSAITNRPAAPTSKVSLSNCRALGPSYRLLPKRERMKKCMGRDELCKEVLNDDWASHPTWASEDSGFVAHRKNGFEEALHKIEEERHDYDFHIEVNHKCIQLLEPLAQQMLAMPPAERAGFHMPTALLEQNQSLFRRVCKKLYAENGIAVLNDLFTNPFEVVPVLLARLKQKDEEWRFSQREWNRVWLTQTENLHLKSLDHMGIQVKAADKKNLSAKHLVDLIKTKAEDQRRQNPGSTDPHLSWGFRDKNLVIDLIRLVLVYNHHNVQHSSGEKERIGNFFLEFVTAYFDVSEQQARERMPEFPDDSEEDAEEPEAAEVISGRGRRNAKRSDLRRGVLDRAGGGNGGGKSRNSGSKETTPDVGSIDEDHPADGPGEPGAPNDRWLPRIPRAMITTSDPRVTSYSDVAADGQFARQSYNLFCNQTLFVFFSILHVLYQRLGLVKGGVREVTEALARMDHQQQAQKIGLAREPQVLWDYKPDQDPSEYWAPTMELIEKYLGGDVDEPSYQDILRHYFIQSGWRLYTIQDLIRTLCRLSLICTSSDAKEKTPELVQQHLHSRKQDVTSYDAELAVRKAAEKYIKDGEMFLVTWYPDKAEAKVRWMHKDDATFQTKQMRVEERWQYYISSFVRIEPTEGVNRSRMKKAVLTRNIPGLDADADPTNMPRKVSFKEDLGYYICMHRYALRLEGETTDYMVLDHSPATEEQRQKRAGGKQRMKEYRAVRFRTNFVLNNAWMKDLSQEAVQSHKNEFQALRDGAPSAPDPENPEQGGAASD